MAKHRKYDPNEPYTIPVWLPLVALTVLVSVALFLGYLLS